MVTNTSQFWTDHGTYIIQHTFFYDEDSLLSPVLICDTKWFSVFWRLVYKLVTLSLWEYCTGLNVLSSSFSFSPLFLSQFVTSSLIGAPRGFCVENFIFPLRTPPPLYWKTNLLVQSRVEFTAFLIKTLFFIEYISNFFHMSVMFFVQYQVLFKMSFWICNLITPPG